MDNSTQFKCNRVSKYEVNPRELIFHDYMVRPPKVLLPQLQIIRHYNGRKKHEPLLEEIGR